MSFLAHLQVSGQGRERSSEAYSPEVQVWKDTDKILESPFLPSDHHITKMWFIAAVIKPIMFAIKSFVWVCVHAHLRACTQERTHVHTHLQARNKVTGEPDTNMSTVVELDLGF